MDNFSGPLSVRITELTVNIMRPMTPYLNWEKLGGGRVITKKERVSRYVASALITGDL